MNKKILAFSMLGVFALAMVTAGLVGYLSNEVEVSVTVESPVLFEVSLTGIEGDWLSDPATLHLDNVYGGEGITFWARDTNLADVFTPGKSLKLVTNEDGVTCNDFASVTADGFNLLTDEGCVQVDNNTVDFSYYTSPTGGLAANGEDGDSSTNEIVMTFKPDALGEYIFTMQKMIILEE